MIGSEHEFKKTCTRSEGPLLKKKTVLHPELHVYDVTLLFLHISPWGVPIKFVGYRSCSGYV